MAAKKTAKKSTARKPKTEVKIIQSLDRMRGSLGGTPRYLVYFNDGTQAETLADAKFNKTLGQPETVAPNMVMVTFERGKIVDLKPVDKP